MENNKQLLDSKALIYRDKAGQSWFFGVYSNNFEDKQKETLSWEGHEEYATWVKQAGVKFPITICHQPKYPDAVHLAQFIGLNSGLFSAKEFSDNYLKLYEPYAFAQTEMIIPLNGFMFVVGKILDGKETIAESLAQVDPAWRMSHGFIPFKTSGSITDRYRTFEFTTLPPALAANQYTLFDVKENKKMEAILKGLSDEDSKKLKEFLDVDPGKLEDATQFAHELLSKVVSSKELGETEDVEETEETEEVVEEKSYDEIRVKLFSDLDVEGLQGTLKQVVDEFKTVNTRLDGVEGRITTSEKSDDEKIADQLFKPQWDMFGETKGEDAEDVIEKLKTDALGDSSVVDQTKQKADESPLKTMLWGPLLGQKQ